MTDQRQLGVDLFNRTWRLIESREDDDLMIDCAHASAYHWAVAPECKPENRARSAWLLSRVYAVAGRSEPALHHAERCLQLCEQTRPRRLGPRVRLRGARPRERGRGRLERGAAVRELARAVPIQDADDRTQLEGDLATI